MILRKNSKLHFSILQAIFTIISSYKFVNRSTLDKTINLYSRDMQQYDKYRLKTQRNRHTERGFFQEF